MDDDDDDACRTCSYTYASERESETASVEVRWNTNFVVESPDAVNVEGVCVWRRSWVIS